MSCLTGHSTVCRQKAASACNQVYNMLSICCASSTPQAVSAASTAGHQLWR
jgi:hypothetical protein